MNLSKWLIKGKETRIHKITSEIYKIYKVELKSIKILALILKTFFVGKKDFKEFAKSYLEYFGYLKVIFDFN
jgi:hypothetical protein